MKFLFPEKPNHPDVSGRLDIFAKFGPVLDYHMLDLCFCKDCKIPLREGLINLGVTLKFEKDKSLSDDFIFKQKTKLCKKCFIHIEKWSHLYSGKEQTHIMTNEEISFLIYETNKEDLLQILKVISLLKIRLKRGPQPKLSLKNSILRITPKSWNTQPSM
jgi:hypothetical protein